MVLPFSYVIPLLGLLDTWLKVRKRGRDRQTGRTETKRKRWKESSVLLFEILCPFICGQRGWEVELSCRCLLFLLR